MHSAVSTSSSLSCLKPVSCTSPADTLVPDIQVSECVLQCEVQNENTPRKRCRSSNRNEKMAKEAANKENQLTAFLLPIKSPKMIRHGSSFRMKPKKLHQQMKLRRAHSLKYLSQNSPVQPTRTCGITMPVQASLFRVTVSQINE